MSGETSGIGAVGIRCQLDIHENGWYSWRVTANNGRVIALGAITYVDDKQCRAALRALCENVGDLTGGVQHAAESNGWVWRLRDPEGRLQAESARAYERHSTCQSAYERFRLLLSGLAELPSIPWGDA